MTNFIILRQAKIDGEEEPKVTMLGTVAFRPDSIMQIYSLQDKFERPIKNVSAIVCVGERQFLVHATMEDILEAINEANVTS